MIISDLVTTSSSVLVLHQVPAGETAIWERIAAEMRKRIDSGLWAGGQQLMAEAELATELGVARGTLRRAIKDLRESGHLVQRHGRGTFVSKSASTPLANRMESLGERMTRGGIDFTTTVLTLQVAPQANEWGFDPGPVLVLRRLRSIEGAPIAVLSNALPIGALPGIAEKDLVTRPLYTILEEDYGVSPVRAERTFRAVAADAPLAAELGVEIGDPILHFVQVAWGSDDAVLDVSETWVRSDRHQPSVSMWRTV